MSSIKLAKRYAKAFMATTENDTSAQTELEKLVTLNQTITDESVKGFFLNPAVSKSEKSKSLESISTKLGMDKNTASLVGLLVHNDRLEILSDLISTSLEILDQRMGITRVNVKVTDEKFCGEFESVKGKLSDKLKSKVIPEFEIDPSILGGMIIGFKGTVYDASVKNYLTNLKNNILN